MAIAHSNPADGKAAGRYAVYDSIASGGMASVHIGRYRARFGFSRTVAVKRLHNQYAKQPEFVAMLVDEARLASRINHPNVVDTLDVVFEQDEVLLVMEYVAGESLAVLLRESVDKQRPLPVPIVVGILCGALRGLHAAHVAKAEDGSMLGIVHRDMSPQNIMVGVDGVAKVLDFGVAKAALRSQTTSQGQIKGKFAYMAPEQILTKGVDARTDVFACGVVLWECLALRRLFSGDDLGETIGRMLHAPIPRPSELNPEVPPELDAVVLRALAREPADRFQTAAEFAEALEGTLKPARTIEIGLWVQDLARESISARARLVADVEANRRPEVDPSHLPHRKAPTASSTASTVVVLQEPPRRRWAFVVAVTLAGIGLSVGAFSWGSWRAERDARALASSPPMPSAAATQAPAAVDPPLPGAVPSPVEPAPPSVTATATPSQSPSPALRSGPASKTAGTSKASCNPPYWIDKNGIRRVRSQCL